MSKSARLTVDVWYDPENPNVIQLSSDDPRLTDEEGKRKGVLMAVSVNRRPKTYQYLHALLQGEGIHRP